MAESNTNMEPSSSSTRKQFSVSLSKEDFKFNCAHFIAYSGFRERLHGHNYQVSVKLSGETIGHHGYLIDFGEIKKGVRDICKSLNEYFICPMKSDVLTISEMIPTSQGNMVHMCIECEDGAKFTFPKADCRLLPIVHSSAEELAHYIYCNFIRKLGIDRLAENGILNVEVSVAECAGQLATFSHTCPRTLYELESLEILSMGQPHPCL